MQIFCNTIVMVNFTIIFWKTTFYWVWIFPLFIENWFSEGTLRSEKRWAHRLFSVLSRSAHIVNKGLVDPRGTMSLQKFSEKTKLTRPSVFLGKPLDTTWFSWPKKSQLFQVFYVKWMFVWWLRDCFEIAFYLLHTQNNARALQKKPFSLEWVGPTTL